MKIPYTCKIEEYVSTNETRPILCDLWLEVYAPGKGRLMATDDKKFNALLVETEDDEISGIIPVEAVKVERIRATGSVYKDEDGDDLRTVRPLEIHSRKDGVFISDGIFFPRPKTEMAGFSWEKKYQSIFAPSTYTVTRAEEGLKP